jgi:hypothetical protein
LNPDFRADPRQGTMFTAPFSSRAAERALTDEALMARADAADPRAFAVIFDRHGGAALSLGELASPVTSAAGVR